MNIMETKRLPLNCDETATDVLNVGRFVSFMDTGDVYVWKSGALVPAELMIRKMVEAAHPDATNHEKEEVVTHVRDRTLRERANAEDESWPYFATENGVIDIRPGGKFLDFEAFEKAHPEIFLFNKLPLKYDPEARCPTYWRFLTRALPHVDDQTVMWDHFASVLDKRPLRRRALLCYGPPGTGKTTQLNVEVALIGGDNYSSVPLQQLCGEDRFATSRIYGKLLNIYDDLADVPLKYLGQFRVITGGGVMSAQRKGRDGFDFKPYVKLHFTTNKAPGLKDVSDEAWWTRWDALAWTVEIEKAQRDFATKLTAPCELSGIFNQLLKVVRNQIRTGHFRIERSPIEVQDIWLGQAEPVRNFLTSQAYPDPNGVVTTRELRAGWEKWRLKRKPIPADVSRTRLNELTTDIYGIAPTLYGPKRIKAWRGIGLRGADRGQTELESEREERLSTTLKETIGEYKEGVSGKKASLSSRISIGLGALFSEPEAQP